METGKSNISTIQGEIYKYNSEKVTNQDEREQLCDMSPEEDDLILHRLHRLLGDRWGLIAQRLPNRKEEEVERYWRMKEKDKFEENKLFKPISVRLSPSFKYTMSH